MPTLTVQLQNSGALGPGLHQRLVAFDRAVRAAQQAAAIEATRASRAKVKRVRDLAPARAKRYHGLADAIRWAPLKDGGVGLASEELSQKFPPWLVQEIGTDQRAVQRIAGRPNPTGRPTAGASYVKTVKPQHGRRISNYYVFVTGGGLYSKPRQGAHGEALVPRSLAKNAPVRFDSATRRAAAGIVIQKEIEGQHFIRDGGRDGFREYRTSVLAAARAQLRKSR
jgi:hypothetical protein